MYLQDHLTAGIIDHQCVFTNVSTALLNLLFKDKWRQWIRPTREGLKSASHHSLKIIGKIEGAKLELGSIEMFQDIQIVEDNRPLLLIGNDICYDRITNHDGRFVTIRCQPGGPAREIIPITYGHQVVFAAISEKVCLRPRTAIRVPTTLASTTAGEKEQRYLDSFKNADVHVENIRYGPASHLDDIVDPPLVDEEILTVDSDLHLSIVLNNPGHQFRTFEKGELIARVVKVRTEQTFSGATYFVQVEVPDTPEDLLSQTNQRLSSGTGGSVANAQPNVYLIQQDDRTPPSEDLLAGSPPHPNVFLMPSHDEDLADILQGSEEGDIPLPSGYELADLPTKFDEYSINDIKTPHLTAEQRERILAVCHKHAAAFAKNSGDIGKCTYGEFDMTIGDTILKPEPYRPCPKAYVDEVDAILQGMRAMNVIGLSDSPYATNLVISRRPNHKLRVCLDSRGVNLHLKNLTAWPIPPQEESLEKLAKANISSTLDVLKAFWGIGLSERARPLTAFYWKNQLLSFRVSPYGIRSLPGYYNMLMAHLLRNYQDFTYWFFDDVLLFSSSFDEHLEHLDRVLERVCESGFKLQPAKCQIGVPKSQPLKWLGSYVVNNQLVIDPIKIRAVEDLPIPKNGKELLKGLSLVSYLRKFLPHLATVVTPLHDLVNASFRKKDPHFEWLPIHTERFNLMKKMVTHAPALRLLNMDNPLIVCSDASNEACGGLIAMIHDEENGEGPQEYVCGYVSRRFTSAEKKRLTVPEREMTGILYAVNCWSQYLIGRPRFTLRTDASALLYLHAFKNSTPRLMKASLHLQELNYEVEHMSARDGNSMSVCDYLSRAYSEIPEITLSWQNLRNSVFNQIQPPPNWPKQPLSKEAFAAYADEYFRTFCPIFPEGTKELERLKISYFHRDREDPVMKQRILDRERELKQEYYRQSRSQPLPSVDISQPRTPTTSSDPATQLTLTNGAEPPSSNRSSPPSHVSSQSSFFSASGEEEGSDSDDSEFLSAHQSDFDSNSASNVSEKGSTHLSLERSKNLRFLVNFSSSEHEDERLKAETEAKMQETIQSVPGVGHLTPSEMVALQRADPSLLCILNRFHKMSQEEKEKSPFFLRQEVLCRRMRHRGITRHAVALPKVLRIDALRMIHGDSLGTEHIGLKKTQTLAHRLFYWPRMADDIKSFVAACINCVHNTSTTLQQVGFQRRMTAPAMATNTSVSLDLVINLPLSVGGYRHIVVFVCNFSRFVVMVPLRTKEPGEVARAFLSRWCGVIGVPLYVHGDAGTDVDSSFMQRFCRVLAVRKSRTPSFSPNSNAIVETINRSVGSLLRTATFPGHLQKRWPMILPWITLCLNETPSTVHGFKPRQLMFGHTPSYVRLPLVSWDSPVIGEEGFLKATRAGQQFAWDVVKAQQMRIHSPAEKSKRRHNFSVGDFVVIKNHEIGAPLTNKLREKYRGPFRVLQAYEVSLVVQKWLGANDPLVTQGLLHHHRMDAKHIECRIVNARDCKKYPKMEQLLKGPGVNPELIRMFLKKLGHKVDLDEPVSSQGSEGPYELDVDPQALKAVQDDSDSESPNSDPARKSPELTEQPGDKIQTRSATASKPLAPNDPPSAAAVADAEEPSLPAMVTSQEVLNPPLGDSAKAAPDSSTSKASSPAGHHPADTPATAQMGGQPSSDLADPPLASTPVPSDPAGTGHRLARGILSASPIRAPRKAADAAVSARAATQDESTEDESERKRHSSAPPSVERHQTSKTAGSKENVSGHASDPEPLMVRRSRPNRAAKTRWKEKVWPQVLSQLRPRPRRQSAPQLPDKVTHLMEGDALLTRDMERSKRKNDPANAQERNIPNPSGEQTLYHERIANWVQQPDQSGDGVSLIATQHERDEQSQILTAVLGPKPQETPGGDTTLRLPPEEGDSKSAEPDSTEKPVSAPSYVNET